MISDKGGLCCLYRPKLRINCAGYRFSIGVACLDIRGSVKWQVIEIEINVK